MNYGIATTNDELDQAFKLVHDNYVACGFMDKPNANGRRVDIRHSLPTTKVFVAQLDGKVIGTATLAPDSPLGLPMDDCFKDVTDGYRRQGQNIGEVTALAWQPGHNRFSMLLKLLKDVLAYSVDETDLDGLCFVVKPERVSFYEELFGCKVIAEPRDFHKVNIMGARALHLNLRELR